MTIKHFFEMRLGSSRPKGLYEKGVIQTFAKLTGKHLCVLVFLNKFAGPADSLKKRLQHRLSCKFCESFESTFFIEQLLWLLLRTDISPMLPVKTFYD